MLSLLRFQRPPASRRRQDLSPRRLRFDSLEERALLSLSATLPLDLGTISGDFADQAAGASVAQAKLTAPGGTAHGEFARSIAMSGNTLVVGVPGATLGDKSGVVYVYSSPDGGWSDSVQPVARLTSSGTGGSFGCSVAISGDTIVVGAENAGNRWVGEVYVFVKSGGEWADMTESAKLTASDAGFADGLGHSVAISGDTVVAGAWSADVGGNNQQGAAYVFTKPVAGWANPPGEDSLHETVKLISSDGEAEDNFGSSVAIDGETVVVGATNAGHYFGAAYVFANPLSGGAIATQSATLTPSYGMQFGRSVAILGDTVFVGEANALIGAGAVSVYVQPVAGWSGTSQPKAVLTTSDAEPGYGNLGCSLAISGDTLVSGAEVAKGGAGDFWGAAYTFIKPTTGWIDATESGKLAASEGGGNFGASVAFNGETIVVGAPELTVGANERQGAAYVFARPQSGPAITGINPSAGPVAGGTTVTITGTDLAGARKVLFGNKPATIKKNTATQIVAVSPKGTPGTVNVTVVTPKGTSSSAPFTYVAAPMVTGISPKSGPLVGGTNVSIAGANLEGASAVMFGKTKVTTFEIVDSQILVASPPGKPGTVDVRIVTAGGTSRISPADKFSYVAAPMVTKINPKTGPTTGGTRVTITGKNLAKATEVLFGTLAAQIVRVTAAQIVVLSPAGTEGTVDVRVVTAGGTSAVTENDKFTYVSAPGASGLATVALSSKDGRLAMPLDRFNERIDAEFHDAAILALTDASGPGGRKNRAPIDAAD